MRLYSFLDVRGPLWVLFNTYLPLTIHGRENIPDKGPFVFCSNHASHLDPIVLGYSSLYRQIGFMAKEELFRIPVFGFLIRHWGAFPVKRNQRDQAAMQEFADHLRNDKPLVLFPEGTRTLDGNFLPPKKGVGKLLYTARVPVIPVYIDGTFKTFPKHKSFPRPGRIHAHIGLPVDLDDLYALPEEKNTYRLIAERVMERVTALKTQCVIAPDPSIPS
jgi:1-acyl-sn-glycerol-3-phosphate acyltransferase